MGIARSLLYWEPLTDENWDRFTGLFGSNGACGGCWCMLWRTGTRRQFEDRKGRGNRDALRRLVRKGACTGIMLFARGDEQALGWCSIAPREHFPGLTRSRVLKPVDDRPVWSITCLYVRRDLRTHGLSKALINGAADHARAHGARIVEGYPMEPSNGSMPDAFAWTGLVQAYRAAGFREVARHSPTRPIMRRTIRQR